MNPYWERVLGGATVIGLAIAYLAWLFPDLAFSSKLALGIPMAVAFGVVLVLPDRQGLPYGASRSSRVRFRRKFAATLSGCVLFVNTIILYTFLFPAYSYFYPVPPSYLANGLAIPYYSVIDVAALVVFLKSVRAYFASLPPA